MPQQRPKKQDSAEGRIIIARNIHWSLPTYLRNAIESPFAQDRLAALESLAYLHRVGNDSVRDEVVNQTRRLIHDDSKAVSTAATKFMAGLSPEQIQPGITEQARPEAETQVRRDAEEKARREAREKTQREAAEQARRKAPRGRAPSLLLEAMRRMYEKRAGRKAEEQIRPEAEEQEERQDVTSPPRAAPIDVFGSSAPRQVNAWLAEPEGRWRDGALTVVLFDIGPQRFPAVVSGHLVEPPLPVGDNGQWLYVLLLADAASVRPVGAPLWLPAEGATAILRFEVTPMQPGPLVLRFRVFLQQGSLLLQELTATVTVAGQPIATRPEQQ
jgi:hypothetical protein